MFKGEIEDILFRIVCVLAVVTFFVPYLYTEGTIYDGSHQTYYTSMYTSLAGGVGLLLTIIAFILSLRNHYIVAALLALAATAVTFYAVHVREDEFAATLTQKNISFGEIMYAGGYYWLTTCLIVLPAAALLYVGLKTKKRY